MPSLCLAKEEARDLELAQPDVDPISSPFNLAIAEIDKSAETCNALEYNIIRPNASNHPVHN